MRKLSRAVNNTMIKPASSLTRISIMLLSSYGATSEPLHNSLGQHCVLQFSVSCVCSATPAFWIIIHFLSQLLPCGQCFPFIKRISFSYLNSLFLCFLWVSGRCHLSGRPSFFSKLEDFTALSVLWAPFLFPLVCRVLALEPADIWTSCGLFCCCFICRQRAEMLILPTFPDF